MAEQSGLEFDVLGDVNHAECPVRICTVGSRADAELIAAAPAMYEALKYVERFVDGFSDDPAQDGIQDQLAIIRCVLAKANPLEVKDRWGWTPEEEAAFKRVIEAKGGGA